MTKSKWWKYMVGLILGSIAGYYLTIALMPNVIYIGAQKKIMSRPGSEINKLSLSPAMDASSQAVVMPNPDFLYLTSYYDLSNGPLRLSGNMPDSTYWSVAMYHPNTINWFVKNDMEFKEERKKSKLFKKMSELDLDISIRHAIPLASHHNPEGHILCEKEKGFLLIRVLLTDRSEENVKAYQAILNKLKIEPV